MIGSAMPIEPSSSVVKTSVALSKDHLSYAKTLIAMRHLVWLRSPARNLARASARGVPGQQAQVASCLPDRGSKPHQVPHTYKCLCEA